MFCGGRGSRVSEYYTSDTFDCFSEWLKLFSEPALVVPLQMQGRDSPSTSREEGRPRAGQTRPRKALPRQRILAAPARLLNTHHGPALLKTECRLLRIFEGLSYLNTTSFILKYNNFCHCSSIRSALLYSARRLPTPWSPLLIPYPPLAEGSASWMHHRFH